jgi:hypothetical protein
VCTAGTPRPLNCSRDRSTVLYTLCSRRVNSKRSDLRALPFVHTRLASSLRHPQTVHFSLGYSVQTRRKSLAPGGPLVCSHAIALRCCQTRSEREELKTLSRTAADEEEREETRGEEGTAYKLPSLPASVELPTDGFSNRMICSMSELSLF